MPGFVFETGSELYAGLSQQSPGNAWLGDSRNDNLLFTLAGAVRLAAPGFRGDFPAGTLLALEPGVKREFRALTARAAFYTKFRETFGMSPHRYRENELFRQCRHLLESTDYPLKQIAEMLGCSSSFYLSSRFRKWAGIPPTEYRRRFLGL